MKLNQKGFSGVEALLIVVIIAMVGGVGYYVYQSRQETKKSQDNANKSSQEIEAEKKTEPTVAKKDYFEVKELGVKFETSEKLKGLYYYIGNEGKSAYFSLDEFKGNDCAANKTAQVAVTKATEAELASDPAGAALKQNAQKLGDNYYYTLGGQASCSDNEATQAKASAMRQAVVEATKGKLELIQ